MTEARNALTTSSPKPRSTSTNGRAVAVILKPLIDLHGEPKNWATAALLYMEALADIPPDLLALAVKHAITSNPYFPKPAELRLSIADELSAWRRKRDAERLALLPRPAPEPPATMAEKAEVDALVQQALQAIAGRRDHVRGYEYQQERSEMLLLSDDDPRRAVWNACESPIEQLLCHAAFYWLDCKAVAGSFGRNRLDELHETAGDRPASYLFSQQKAGRYRLDFLLVAVAPGRDDWIALECDGRRFHTTHEHVEADRKRDEGLADIGIQVMRFTGAELYGDMRRAMRRISEWLNASGVPSNPTFGGILGALTPDPDLRAERARQRREYWEAEAEAKEDRPANPYGDL